MTTTTKHHLVVERLQFYDDLGSPLYQVHVEVQGRPVTDVAIVTNWVEFMERSGYTGTDEIIFRANAWGNDTIHVVVIPTY